MRKWKWLIIVLILGGFMTFFSLNHQSQKVEDELIQEIIACNIYNNYENIHKIEFENISKNDMTGSWNSDAIINEEIYVKLTLFEGSNDVNLSELSSRNSNKFLVKKDEETNNLTTDNIKIIFVEK